MPPLPKRVDAQKAALQLFRERGRVQADALRSEFVVVGRGGDCGTAGDGFQWWVLSPAAVLTGTLA
eukprot:2823426-Rhodomonas_salina.1